MRHTGLGRFLSFDSAPDERTRVIVVRVNGQTAGLVVDEVLALLPAQTGEHKRFSIARDTTVHMITVGQGEAQKSYRVLDLGALPFADNSQDLLFASYILQYVVSGP